MFSFVFWKDNPIYNMAEHVFVAVGAGHAVVASYFVLKGSGWDQMAKGNMGVLIPIALGLLLFARYFKGVAWLTRPSVAVVVACGAGLGLRGAVRADFLDQIRASFLPLTSLNNFIFILGVASVIAYFFFTQHYTRITRGRLSIVNDIGQYFMMVAFGASFGQACMGRLSTLIDKISFLLKTVLRVGA
jgi:hypothetical protein